MKKKSPLLVPGVENYIERYREEIAHEFGIFYSQQQVKDHSSIHHLTRQILKKKKKTTNKKQDNNDSC